MGWIRDEIRNIDYLYDEGLIDKEQYIQLLDQVEQQADLERERASREAYDNYYKDNY